MLSSESTARVVTSLHEFGAGISVYTAFFAFGAVRFIPELALQPGLWAVPLIVGLTLIIYHQRVVTRPLRSKLGVA